jgi:hypothetical protein
MRSCRSPAIAAAALLVAACASAPTPDSKAWLDALQAIGFRPGEAVESIPHFRIDGFNVIDSAHVVLYTGANRSHVVILRDGCPALAFADRLGYTTSAGALTRFDKLLAIGRERESPCQIESMRVLERIQVSR